MLSLLTLDMCVLQGCTTARCLSRLRCCSGGQRSRQTCLRTMLVSLQASSYRVRPEFTQFFLLPAWHHVP